MTDPYEEDRRGTRMALAAVELMIAPEPFRVVLRRAIRRHGALQLALGVAMDRLTAEASVPVSPATASEIAKDLEKAMMAE